MKDLRKNPDVKEDTQVMPCALEHTRPMPKVNANRKARIGASGWRFFQLTKNRLALILVGGFIVAAILGYASAQYARDRLELAANEPVRQTQFADAAPKESVLTSIEEAKGKLNGYADAISEKKDVLNVALDQVQAGADDVKSVLRKLNEVQVSAEAFAKRHEADIHIMQQFIEEKQKLFSQFLSKQFGESGMQKNEDSVR